MKVLLEILLFVSLCALISCDGHFTIIGSTSVNQNGKYSVAITSRNVSDSDPPILEVAIHSIGDGGKMAQNITLINGKSQSMEFDMNSFMFGDYVNLTINCIKGPNFTRNVQLNLNNKSVSAFVQTDKAIYRPSDTVRFRVLVLDENLKPLQPKNVIIFVIDGAQNRVKQFPIDDFKKGIFEEEFKLSDSPILGNWYIETLLPNNVVKRQSFEVAEYALPSFEIILDVKPHVCYAEKQITAFLVARHTFSKPAKGDATITAELENSNVTKSVKISGRTSVEFDIEKDLGIKDGNVDRIVKLFVTFTDEVTGKSGNTSAAVHLYVVPYKLNLKPESTQFKPGLRYSIEAIVEYHDTNVDVTDNEHPVTFNVTLVKNDICKIKETVRFLRRRRKYFFENICSGGFSKLEKYTVYPSEGISKIEFTVPENIDYLNVSVSYLQTNNSLNKILRAPSEKNHFIRIKSKTETPTLKENVKINIQSLKNFTEFSYHVFSVQGRLISSDTIQVSPTQDHDFEFTPTDDIKNKIKIMVFYITDYGEIVFDSLLLEFNELKNFVDIQISEESVRPNDEILINISSSPNSVVGLLGTDRSQSILKKVNDTRVSLRNENKSEVFFIIHPGSKSFIPFSGLSDGSTPHYEEDDQIEFREEEYRSGKWLFAMVDFGVDEKKQTISWKVPNTITHWSINAFSINPTTGLAKTSRSATLKVFKSFFVSMDLPYSIRQNEIVSVQISVFNYMTDDQETDVTLYNDDSEFTFIEPGNDNDRQMTKSLHVKADSGASTSFNIRTNRTGEIKLKASAKSLSSPGDGTVRYLRVKPEGIVKYKNDAVLIDLSGGDDYKTYNLNIFIPQEAVDGSIRIEASVMGDVLGLSGNLQNLLKLPVGCSEQNMINFVPNIVVLNYLRAVNKLTKEVSDAAIEYLELGYQKQLRYKNDDGSFNVWGKIDESGSTWLTAYIVKYFGQAQTYIFVEPAIIEKGLRFLSQTQLEDGSFEEVGYVFRKDIQIASSNRIALTAYVLIAFLEHSDYIETHKNTIDKAVHFIIRNFNDITDNYSLAIATYVLQLAHFDDQSFRNISLTKLEKAAIRDGETLRWRGSASEVPHHTNPFDTASSLDVETTAYALHAFVIADRLHDSVRITKWLVTQRNENGGFISTQDTVVALQALSQVATRMNSTNSGMDVTVKYGGTSPLEFYVNKRNALVLQTKDVPMSARNFNITARGDGFSIFQISYRYNVDQLNDESYKFNISRTNVSETADEKTFCLEFCVNYNQDENSSTSNMAVVEVKFPIGCAFEEKFSNELRSTKNIKNVDYRDGTSVIVYLDHLSAENICPRFHYSNSKPIDNRAQHGLIQVYDYYDIKRRSGILF